MIYFLEVREGDAAVINSALGFHLEWQEETDGQTRTQQYADSVEAFNALGNLAEGTVTVTLSEGAHEEALGALEHHCEVFGDAYAYPEWDQWDPAYRAALALGASESELTPWCPE